MKKTSLIIFIIFSFAISALILYYTIQRVKNRNKNKIETINVITKGDSVMINDFTIKKGLKTQELIDYLGEYRKNNVAIVFDNYGIIVFSKNGYIQTIHLSFIVIDEYVFPKKSLNGKLMINNIKVDKETTKEDILSVFSNNIESKSSNNVEIKIGNLRFSVNFRSHKISSIMISFLD